MSNGYNGLEGKEVAYRTKAITLGGSLSFVWNILLLLMAYGAMRLAKL